jgi:hypothetical protein
MNDVMKKFRSFCSPTQVYVVISFFSILALLSQNIASSHKYTVGKYSCNLEHHNMFFFLFKIIYVFAWTFILQELCKNGYKSISWFLVLLPFILFFVIIGLFLLFNIFK